MSATMAPVLFGVFVLHLLSPGSGFSSGAPASACEDMVPRHNGVLPQSSPAPYTIHTSSLDLQPDQSITVTVKGPGYRGLLLQARSESGFSALGHWQSPPNDTRFQQCSGNPQGAMTHSNTNMKGNSTMFTWTPPRGISTIYFIATVAQQRTVFWLNVRSEKLSGGTTAGVVEDLNRTCGLWNSGVVLLLFSSFLLAVLVSS